MLIWITALHCEAKPVIDFYRLKKSRLTPAFDVYRGDDMHCIVSGIGKLASASATAWSAARFGDEPALAWINLGIAGAGAHAVGSAFTLDKIIDAELDQAYYPIAVTATSFASAGCLTLSRPCEEYRDDLLYDMEASGFVSAALRFSSAELVQAIKVVGDNRDHQTGKNAAATSSLIAQHMDAVDRQAQALRALKDELAARALAPAEWQQLLQLAHFTETQQNRLRVLWRYLRNRRHSRKDLLLRLEALTSARAMLATLEEISHRDSEEL